MYPQALSKAKLSFFRSLKIQKHRKIENILAVEGLKMHEEALASGWEVVAVVGLQEKIAATAHKPSSYPRYVADAKDFAELSSQVSPEGIISYVRPPLDRQFWEDKSTLPADYLAEGKGFLLQNIQDPGNLGTILRIADWFGLSALVCSSDTADVSNPKVLRASMGAIFRVKVLYVSDFPHLIAQNIPYLLATTMQGQPLAEVEKNPPQWLLLGNEAQGISADLLAMPALRCVTIPRLGGAESLNVSVAAGIFAYQLFSSSQT
jgi:RNA methyltransferase, TrmH family